MPVVLYAWEYGHDLGHVSVFLPIAKQLRHEGWHVISSIPYMAGGGKARQILEVEGFTCIEVASAEVQSDRTEVDNHVELVSAMPGFRSDIEFDCYFAKWLGIVERFRPHVVVGDFSLIALLVARTKGIPTVSLDLGFFVPPMVASILDLPSFSVNETGAAKTECRPSYLEQTAAAVIGHANRTLARHSAKPLASFLDLYQSDLRLILNYPDLTPFGGHALNHFQGAVIADNGGLKPCWPKAVVLKHKVFAYLKVESAETPKVLEALLGLEDTAVVIYLPQCPEALKKWLERPHVTVSDKPFNTGQVYADADLVICHAGAGMIAQSLLHGIALIVFPNHSESRLNAVRLACTGAGIQPPKGMDAKGLQLLIRQSLRDPRMTHKARSFALRNRPADVAHVAQMIADVVPPDSAASAPEESTTQAAPTAQCHDSELSGADVFLWGPSCDSPQWQRLQALAPQVQFIQTTDPVDAVYQARALSRTNHFFTVSDLCEVDEEVFSERHRIPAALDNSVWRWLTVHPITGLTCASDELVCWSKGVIDLFANGPERDDLFGFDRYPTHYTFSRLASTSIASRSAEDVFLSSYGATRKLAQVFGGDIEKLSRHHQSIHARKLFLHMSLGNDSAHGPWSLLSSRLAFLHVFGLQAGPGADAGDKVIRGLFASFTNANGSADVQTISDQIAALHAVINANICKPTLVAADARKSALLKQVIHVRRVPLHGWFTPFDVNSTL